MPGTKIHSGQDSKTGRSPLFRKEKSTPFFRPKLTVGSSNDAFEHEADAVADRVMNKSITTEVHPKISRLSIQRKCAACAEEERVQRKEDGSVESEQEAPDIVSDALNAGGNPMDDNTRSFMENHFGRDFRNVRIHTDTVAAKSADAINALAYTNGSDIIFNQGQYSPDSGSEKRLLAHELTHVVQQTDSQQSLQTKVLRQEHHRGRPEPVPVIIQPEIFGQWQLQPDVSPRRGPRDNKRASGFTGDTRGTYIRLIEVDVHLNSPSTATLTWANRERSRHFRPPHTLHVSPGAGNCTSNCRNVAQSQAGDSHCTPLSPPDRTVEGFADHLSHDNNAKYVTWIDRERGVAFHYYHVPAFAASHGCVRVTEDSDRGAEWIYDNSIPQVTRVRITATPSTREGTRCWYNDARIRRDEYIPPHRHEEAHPHTPPGSSPHTTHGTPRSSSHRRTQHE